MAYATTAPKKFLDSAGLSYFASKLNNYPTNDIIAAVINGIQDALEEKQNTIRFGTTAEWRSRPSDVPQPGEIIVFTDRTTHQNEDGETVNVAGIKIGDGNAYALDLPFIDQGIADQVLAHVNNTEIHVSSEEKTFWNNKLNCEYSNDVLTFTRQ